MSAPQPIRSKPEDYWQSAAFVRRYVGNAVVTTNDNLGCKLFFGASMAAIGQGIQYICPAPTSILYAGCGHRLKGSVMALGKAMRTRFTEFRIHGRMVIGLHRLITAQKEAAR